MKISNVRLGFANNSSSTHSLIFIPGKTVEDNDVEEDFGWQFFTAASKESKNKYVATTLFLSLKRLMASEYAWAVTKEVTGISLGEDAYIDHQSVLDLPMTYGHSYNDNTIDPQFFNEFQQFLLQDELVILGGNDNDEKCHPLDNETSFVLPFTEQCYANEMVCRKDDYGHWTLFNKITGAKIRFRFDREDVTKSATPELVDLKITNKCSENCSFCYMKSTHDGKHAETSDIQDILYKLFGMRVFECAIGGGEPTEHPDFDEIIKECKYYGIVPNFTTKKLDWLGKENATTILENIGSFAFSVTNVKQVKDLFTALSKNNIIYNKNDTFSVSVQVAMGTVSKTQFTAILAAAHLFEFSVTLLGFKDYGRGIEFKKTNWQFQEYSWWLEVVKDSDFSWYGPRIGIDTLLAKEFEEQLQQENVPATIYETQEGLHSCYIDAVHSTIGASSYGAKLETIKDDKGKFISTDAIAKIFRNFAEGA